MIELNLINVTVVRCIEFGRKNSNIFLCLRTYFGMALDTQFKSVLRAPCFHFSAFASLDPSGVEVAA